MNAILLFNIGVSTYIIKERLGHKKVDTLIICFIERFLSKDKKIDRFLGQTIEVYTKERALKRLLLIRKKEA